jgi:hypothetical protein
MDGVSAGGRRLAKLINDHAPARGGCLSFVAHSLGGVYSRSALCHLEEEDWFTNNGIIALNFITTASPYLGTAEVGRFLRSGSWALGGVLRSKWATVSDLMLDTDALPLLCGDVGIRALSRFQQRVLYGNLDDDQWVRPGTGLILPDLPELPQLETGVPSELPVNVEEVLANLPENPLIRFAANKHDKVREMLRKLNSLPWKRYIVHFPYSRKFTGIAHSKICCHGLEDPNKEGAQVVDHLCSVFLPEEAAPR